MKLMFSPLMVCARKSISFRHDVFIFLPSLMDIYRRLESITTVRVMSNISPMNCNVGRDRLRSSPTVGDPRTRHHHVGGLPNIDVSRRDHWNGTSCHPLTAPYMLACTSSTADSLRKTLYIWLISLTIASLTFTRHHNTNEHKRSGKHE